MLIKKQCCKLNWRRFNFTANIDSKIMIKYNENICKKQHFHSAIAKTTSCVHSTKKIHLKQYFLYIFICYFCVSYFYFEQF